MNKVLETMKLKWVVMVAAIALASIASALATDEVKADHNPAHPDLPVSDYITCGKHLATIIGTNGSDHSSIGTNGRDVFAGLGGDDNIWGLRGNDVICGDQGNDAIYGNEGADDLRGGDGNDTLYAAGDGIQDHGLVGGPGYDVCVLGSEDLHYTGCEEVHYAP